MLDKLTMFLSRQFGARDTDRDLDGLPPYKEDTQMLGSYTKHLMRAFGTNSVAEEAHTNPDLAGGWEGRSDTSAFKRFIVFEVGGIADAAAFRAWALGERNLAFKSLHGSWKGQQNPAFIVEDTPSNRLHIAYWVRKQEAILCLGPAFRWNPATGYNQLFGNREAILDYLEPDGYTVRDREPLPGKWSAVSKATALRQDSWTFDPTENQYYAVI